MLLRLHQTRGPARHGQKLSKLVWKFFHFASGVEIFCLWCGNILSLVRKFVVPGVEICCLWHGKFCLSLVWTFLLSFLSYNRNEKFPHQRRKFPQQNRKVKNILNAGVSIFTKRRGKYSFPEKKNYKINICCNTYNNFYHTS